MSKQLFLGVLGSCLLAGRYGWFGTVVKNYHNNEHYTYKNINVNNGILVTLESQWIDPIDIKSDIQCYKKTNIYFRPIQIFHNGKHVYTDPTLKYIKWTNNYRTN